MLTMQDPADGGVYHKCTTAEFEGFIRPEAARDTRYVVQKSTAAALDFAAVTAQAARVFRAFERELPGLSDSCLSAARKAWTWAQQNPAIIYDQDKLNARFDPDINTGAYGDGQLKDEFIWAAVELFLSTSEAAFLQAVELFPEQWISLQNWTDVRTMAYFSLLRHRDQLPPAARVHLPQLQRMFEQFAREQVEKTAQQAYRAPVENDVRHFVWGSTAVCANQGMALIYAYRLSGDKNYLDHALADLDYLLGRNATGYSFVTGYGAKTPVHPHHRPSEADDVEAPVPGLLAGGPNPGQQDKCPGYPNRLPDESYIDDVCSYASNEVAINWNAPLVYLAFALEILLGKE
jgi:endoglucanase